VGKSIVSAALVRFLRFKEGNSGVMKPATSGCRQEMELPASDDMLLRSLA
jgi:dethiobiotin synthetase